MPKGEETNEEHTEEEAEEMPPFRKDDSPTENEEEPATAEEPSEGEEEEEEEAETAAVGEEKVAIPPREARTWAALCHASALAFFIPLGNVIVPLVLWLLKKDEHPFVDEQGKEVLNFQISMLVYAVVASILTLVVIWWFLLLALLVVDVILVIKGTVTANEGESYSYPLSIRFLR